MGKKKEQEIDLDHLKPEEELKYEIAEELGYLDKVLATGWKSLTAKESGRIGGIIAKKKREAESSKMTESNTEAVCKGEIDSNKQAIR